MRGQNQSSERKEIADKGGDCQQFELTSSLGGRRECSRPPIREASFTHPRLIEFPAVLGRTHPELVELPTVLGHTHPELVELLAVLGRTHPELVELPAVLDLTHPELVELPAVLGFQRLDERVLLAPLSLGSLLGRVA